MTKSRVRKKNGKPVKYTPKPTGISKTKMKKLMELIAQQQELMKLSSEAPGTPEIREEGTLHISDEFTKKLNVVSSDKISEGPELQEDSILQENEVVTDSKDESNLDIPVENEGPVSSTNE
jgi:hypothetical protein